jgi:acyl-CoA reductase-like NAD-dependent aldehyde dehydrogenase
LGVIGIIGTWNYPFFLNAPAIVQALAAGNAVVWKPSELALIVGRKLQESLEESGLPVGLVSAIYGRGEVGHTLLESGIDKGVFTGGVENGRRVLATLGAQGIPAIAELSGFDPAIVLPDAPLESTVRALTWSAFVGAGQTCVAVKRVYVVGRAEPWAEALAQSASALRVGDPNSNVVDVGPMISESARTRFDETIRKSVSAGAHVLAGGAPIPGPGWFYSPTVLLAESEKPEVCLAGCFGPVVIVRAVPNFDIAIDAANSCGYGLAASVWGRNRRVAQAVADRIQAGMVTINDAVTPSAHAGAPFGGFKHSGFGRVHGAYGLREFVQPQVIHVRGPGGFRPQLFPYSDRLLKILAVYRRFFHRP